MIKLRHLLHPIRTTHSVQTLLAEHRRMRKAVSGARFRAEGDSLQGVTKGFASRLDQTCDDAALLGRICAAYIKATERQEHSLEEYRATPWWESIQQQELSAVREALATRDIKSLQVMYRNFYRDPCSSGLILRPPGQAAWYLGGVANDLRRRFLLSEALYRIDYWRSQTGSRFSLSDLQAPNIGNPFGVLLEDTLVASGAEYQHYCAQRVLELLDSGSHLVTEIGGGFGGMAYYLLSRSAKITYINFDVPESLALSAYYLSKALPHRSMLLYGERELTERSISNYDLILMPSWELCHLPQKMVEITFSSHALSDLGPVAQANYLREITRATRQWILYIGDQPACESLSSAIQKYSSSWTFMAGRSSDWNSFRAPEANEEEHLYQSVSD